jgi:hypothetical protein
MRARAACAHDHGIISSLPWRKRGLGQWRNVVDDDKHDDVHGHHVDDALHSTADKHHLADGLNDSDEHNLRLHREDAGAGSWVRGLICNSEDKRRHHGYHEAHHDGRVVYYDQRDDERNEHPADDFDSHDNRRRRPLA